MDGAAARGIEAQIEALRQEFFPNRVLSETACGRMLAGLAPHERVASAKDIEMLVGVLEAAIAAPPMLPAFLIHELTLAVIAGEGPAIGVRPHFSRVLDAADIGFVRRVLEAGGMSAQAVSRAEAEALFDLHDAVAGSANDPYFDELFYRAVTSHLLAAGGHDMPPRCTVLAPEQPLPEGALGAEEAAWLAERIMRDGRATTAELKLLALIGEARDAPDRSVRKFIDFAA